MSSPSTSYEPFQALAPVYQEAGFADYSKALAPRLMNLVFEMDWIGSAALDLGCGTGELAAYLAEHGLRMFGIDSCREMLQQAEVTNAAKGITVEWVLADLRHVQIPIRVDLVTCVGTLNLLHSVNDLELAFKSAANALEPGKLFVFDLTTIRGLAEATGNHILADTDSILVVSQNVFNYDGLTLTQTINLLQYNGRAWDRAIEKHTLRGYPTYPIGKLLAKYGLHLLRVVDDDSRPADANTASRILFLAQKEA